MKELLVLRFEMNGIIRVNRLRICVEARVWK